MIRSPFVVSLAAVCLLGLPALAQEAGPVEDPDVEPRPEDVSTVDGIVRAFYEVISGPPGQARDWARDATLYLPGVTFTPASVDAESGEPRARTIPKKAFIRGSDARLVEHGFVEREIGRSMTRFGNVAHVWSAYEWEAADGQSGRGVNGIHLFHDGDRWWITHATWDDEREGNPIPPEWIDGAGE